MRRTNLMWVVITLSAAWMSPCISFGQGAAKVDVKAEAKTEEAADDKEPSGRLPAHYKEIVTPDQKEKIYAVQIEFNKKIEALAEQIKKLQADRAAAIEALLTAEQKQKLAAAKAAAAKAKETKAAAIKATEEGKVAPASATVPADPKPATLPATTKPAPTVTPKPATPAPTTKK